MEGRRAVIRRPLRALSMALTLMVAACAASHDGEDDSGDEAALEGANGLAGFQWTASSRSAPFRSLTFEKSSSGVTYAAIRSASGATESGRATIVDGHLALERGNVVESFAMTKNGTSLTLTDESDLGAGETYARGTPPPPEPKRAPPLPAARRTLVRIGAHVYAIGVVIAPPGTKRPVTITDYDDATDTWTELPESPLAYVPEGLMAAALPDGSISVVADAETLPPGPGSSLRFDPATKSWKKNESPRVRAQFSLGVCPDGRVYGFGGWAPTTHGTNEALAAPLEIDTGVVAPQPVTVSESAAPHVVSPATVSMPTGKIYVIGGSVLNPPSYNSTPTSREVFEFDCATNAFAARASMKVPRMGHQALHDGHGRIVVFGGATDPHGAPLRSVERFDPGANAWTSLDDLPRPLLGGVAVLGPKPNLVWLGRGGLTYADVLDLDSQRCQNGLDPWL